MSLRDHADAIRSIGRMQAEIEKLAAENARLKTPFGVIETPHILSTGKWSASDLHKDYNWEKIEKSYGENIPLAEENDGINTRNSQLLANLKSVLVTTGFPSEHKVWKRNKWVSVPSEWTSCLHIQYGDGRASLDERYAEYKQRRAKAIADHEHAERLSQRERDKAEQEARIKIAFVDICRSVGLDPLTVGEDDIGDAIRMKCKYLNLAVAGLETRNDWSEGCYRVEAALHIFPIESSLDKEIATEWTSICNTFEDGRSFRDCEHNYDSLLAMANPEAVALWNRHQGHKSV